MVFSASRLSVFGLLSFCCYGYLSQFATNEASLAQMAAALGVATCLQAGAWVYYYRQNAYPSFSEVLLWAISFRLLGIVGNPILEDDFYRYLWDGYSLIEHGTVYALAPQHWFDSANVSQPFQNILDSINNPHIATIYGPVCQFVFSVSYLVSPGQVWPLQLIFTAFDVGILYLLFTLTHSRNVLLYAWCPLVIKEIAFTAHIDSMAVFFLLAACVALLKNRNVLLGLLLALAVGSKVFAILLLPFLLFRRATAAVGFVLGMVLLYAPFLSDLGNAEHGLSAMAAGWVFNAPLYLLLPDHFLAIQLTLGSMFAIVWCYSAWHWHQRSAHQKITNLPRADWIYGAFLLAIPALNPWYLIWLLPFAAIKPSLSAWVASVAVLLSYVIGLNNPGSGLLGYQQPLWAVTIEFGAIFAALIYDLIYAKRSIVSRTASGEL